MSARFTVRLTSERDGVLDFDVLASTFIAEWEEHKDGGGDEESFVHDTIGEIGERIFEGPWMDESLPYDDYDVRALLTKADT